MSDIPVITEIVGREDGRTSEWSVLVSFHCETEEGRILLRFTDEAAHELKGLLDSAPPKVGK